MRNISDKTVQNIGKTHFICNKSSPKFVPFVW